ncbi:hypothetical protein [Ahniella affigens]|nr:hypothetical protein [Ahniella affigens]
MKKFVDELANESGTSLGFANYSTPKKVKQVLKGSRRVQLPLASGVDSPGVQLKGLTFVNRALSAEELDTIYKAGPPVGQDSQLSFTEWLACGIYEVPSGIDEHPQLWISREILIKRVANALGASHPAGTSDADSAENRFDRHILQLHNVKVADGYPATYYQLIEIGKDVLERTKILLFPSS